MIVFLVCILLVRKVVYIQDRPVLFVILAVIHADDYDPFVVRGMSYFNIRQLFSIYIFVRLLRCNGEKLYLVHVLFRLPLY